MRWVLIRVPGIARVQFGRENKLMPCRHPLSFPNSPWTTDVHPTLLRSLHENSRSAANSSQTPAFTPKLPRAWLTLCSEVSHDRRPLGLKGGSRKCLLAGSPEP